MMHNFLLKRQFILVRYYSKFAVTLDNSVQNQLETGEIKARLHPGTVKLGEIVVPTRIQNSILKCCGDYPIKKLIHDSQKLSRYIAARHPPPELELIKKRLTDIETELEQKNSSTESIKEMDEDSLLQYNNHRKNKIQKMLKYRLYAWKPIDYGKYESLVYAIGRSAIEYTILRKILNEIQKNDINFKPRSFFDFGSGIGTGMWAASDLWKDSIFEYYNVDSSKDMNDLADVILRDGNDNQESNLRNVYFRQFLPAKNTQYDLIVSSFSLFELNSKKSRQEILMNLWMKCSNYLIIVEEGSRSGFQLIAEARDYLLQQGLNNIELAGYITSPCPHHFTCPRLTNKDDTTPCNFQIKYENLSIFDQKNKKSQHLYSYVVLKKGIRPERSDYNWPRLIRPTLIRTKHTICKLCTIEGNLKEVVFTASKHGKLAYQCARSSKWGDKLPVNIEEKKVEIIEN